MYLCPEGDELAIAEAAAGFLADTLPIARLHAPGNADLSPDLRRRTGEMGWYALAVAESAGGSGLTAVEHALFFREAGRQCAPVDLLAQCVAANTASSAETRAKLIAGETAVALLVPDNGTWRVLGSSAATLGLLVERDGASLHALPASGIAARNALSPANSMGLLDQLPPASERCEGARIWQLGQLGATAMLVGLAEAALDMIVEYAKVRETFGRKIGAWQAVRHPCADMAVRVEAARSQLWFAATAIKEGRTDAQVHLDAAKLAAGRAAQENADANIQLHGGIGVTDEHDAHLLLKQAMVVSRLFGSKRALLAALLHAEVGD